MLTGGTRPGAVGELDPMNVFAGVVIGDDWVQALLMHVDPNGSVYPIRS